MINPYYNEIVITQLVSITKLVILLHLSVTMNIFLKKKYFLFKSFVKVELSYDFTINLFSTAKNCMEK